MRLCARIIQITTVFPSTDTTTMLQYATAHRAICQPGWTNWLKPSLQFTDAFVPVELSVALQSGSIFRASEVGCLKIDECPVTGTSERRRSSGWGDIKGDISTFSSRWSCFTHRGCALSTAPKRTTQPTEPTDVLQAVEPAAPSLLSTLPRLTHTHTLPYKHTKWLVLLWYQILWISVFDPDMQQNSSGPSNTIWAGLVLKRCGSVWWYWFYIMRRVLKSYMNN